ncbi:small nuclear ribonucleoprotein G [Pancytospora epiphaga]|nr:small nuclear ribonucleoprotein G [Pancytospora epiphaga]
MPKRDIPELDLMMNKKIKVRLEDGCELIGVLDGYDAYSNVTLINIEDVPGFREGVVRSDSIASIMEC